MRLGWATLNEGREVNPDDTPRLAPTYGGRPKRSTKVGRLIPTTLAMRLLRLPCVTALNEGREVNPDDTPLSWPPPFRSRPLNEGREVNPDDTCSGDTIGFLKSPRSTKVGRLIPTTPRRGGQS